MYRRISDGWVKHFDFIVLDLVCLQISFFLAYCIRHGWGNPYVISGYLNIAICLTVSDFVLLLMSGLLNDALTRGYWRETSSCFKSTVFLTLATTFYLFAVQGGEEYSRLVLVYTAVLYFALNTLVRCLWKYFLRRMGGTRSKNAMLVAANRSDVACILEQLRSNSFDLPRITGIIVLDQNAGKEQNIENIPVVADRTTMAEYICDNWVDELLVASDEWDREFSDQLELIAASGVVVHRTIGIGLRNSGRSQLVENFAGYTVLTDSVKIVSLRQAMFKRILDILGGLVGCLICATALLIVGPMIYAQSPGPVIFKQKRVGRNGKIFTIYKMRSMVMDAEQRKKELMEQNRVSDGMMFKLDFDPRIIGAKMLPDGTVKKGIGNFIRDWSIDELPQFFNVLKGDMSLVGTRPPTLDEWNKYQLHHRARMAFRPGITGMWQISGRSEITNFEDVVKLDMQYISGWDIGMDFRILFETVKVVLGRKGAM